MSDIFQNSISGLLAFQRALATTSHNIANVNTEGYSRQRVELGTRTATALGGGFIGSGVESKTVRRIFDQARQTAVEQNTAEFRRLETIAGLARRLDDLVADPSAGLSPALQNFFNGVQDLANDPSSATARQALLTAGENLAGRLRFLDGRLASVERDMNTQLRAGVAEINQLADSIASLNAAIVEERGRTGQPPNDLLDQRDRLITGLSGKIGTRVVGQEDGSLNVFIGSGQILVAGYNANRLEVVPGVDDPERPEIMISTGSGQGARITSTLQGGDVGGLLDFRREILEPTRNELGRIAASVALSVNAQQNRGLQFDLGAAGQMGDDFFELGSPKVIPRPGNTGGGSVTAVFAADAPSALNGSDYRVRWDGANWNVTRLSDGQSVYSGSGPSIDFGEGVEINVGGTPAPGDSFLVQPTRSVAESLRVALTRPSQIAAAAPLAVAEATDATGQTANAGTGAVTGLRINTTDGLPLASNMPLTLTFQADPANPGYRVTAPGGLDYGFISYDPTADADGLTVGGATAANYTAGDDGSLTDIGAVEFTLSGNPQDGDAFVIRRNSGARGDNSNALALGLLAERSILNGGEATFQEAYSSLVGEIGTETLRAEINRDAQESVLNQAKAAREAVSGVNLDEEAANLLKYQQAYQASAQAISIANTLFDSLLAAVQR
jgi:flagellar hook-associated protein 1 FlgK